MPNPCFIDDPGDLDRSLLIEAAAEPVEERWGSAVPFSEFSRFLKWSSAGVEMAEREEIREDMTSGEAGCALTCPGGRCACSIDELVGLELGRCAIDAGLRDVRVGMEGEEGAGLSMLILRQECCRNGLSSGGSEKNARLALILSA